MLSLKKRLPALVLLAALAGCYFDLGEPRPEGQQTQPKAGVLTVIGAEDGISYEAEVYDYPDDDVADAADLADLMRRFEMVGTGLDMPGEEALAIDLLTPDGEDFTADGDFLVVLKDETDAMAPLRYKGAVTFIGGSATIEYDDMETATRRYTVTFDLNYTDAPNPPKPQEIDAGGKATQPAVPARTDYVFGGWFLNAAGTGAAWDFGTDTVKKDVTLYAKWIKNPIVTFNTGAGGSIVPALEVPHGSAAARPANPTRTGYDFDNWYAANADTPYNFNSTVTADITLYAKWKPITFAAVIADMAETANSTSASYTLPSGNETYTSTITPLTTANSPASVTIDGGGRVVTGSGNNFNIGSGVTIMLKNITFKTIPLSVAAGGTLVLDNGAVIRGNAPSDGVIGALHGGGMTQLGIQFIGVVSVGAWVAVTSLVLFLVIKAVTGLRVSAKEEMMGLDLAEHKSEAYTGFQIFSNM
jgi:uncharacterized repeat protein (TIGR02543 family)